MREPPQPLLRCLETHAHVKKHHRTLRVLLSLTEYSIVSAALQQIPYGPSPNDPGFSRFTRALARNEAPLKRRSKELQSGRRSRRRRITRTNTLPIAGQFIYPTYTDFLQLLRLPCMLDAALGRTLNSCLPRRANHLPYQPMSSRATPTHTGPILVP